MSKLLELITAMRESEERMTKYYYRFLIALLLANLVLTLWHIL